MAARAAGSLTLRPMTRADIDAATAVSREQAWPHREEDWALFLEAGEGIVAERDGRINGTFVAAVPEARGCRCSQESPDGYT